MYDQDVATYLAETEHNLDMLTTRIPGVSLDELAWEYHRHIVGVPRLIMHLLHRESQVVICYHNHYD